jgi:hypothetical protein
MKKLHSLIFALIIFYSGINAQKADSIVGQWKFETIYHLNRNDSAKERMTRTLYGQMQLTY